MPLVLPLPPYHLATVLLPSLMLLSMYSKGTHARNKEIQGLPPPTPSPGLFQARHAKMPHSDDFPIETGTERIEVLPFHWLYSTKPPHSVPLFLPLASLESWPLWLGLQICHVGGHWRSSYPGTSLASEVAKGYTLSRKAPFTARGRPCSPHTWEAEASCFLNVGPGL